MEVRSLGKMGWGLGSERWELFLLDGKGPERCLYVSSSFLLIHLQMAVEMNSLVPRERVASCSQTVLH